MRKKIAYLLLLLIIVTVLPGIANAANNTSTASINTTATTTSTQKKAGGGIPGLDIFTNVFKGTKGNIGLAVKILIAAVAIAIIIMIWFSPPSIVGGKPVKEMAFAQRAVVAPPRGYDFIANVVDDVEKTIKKEYFVKISDNLYISTNLSNPTFLYVPEHVETYMCIEGKTAVPCGLAYKKGILSILVDPELAAAHDLAKDANLINIESGELEKLLSALYKSQEKKIGEISISPETRVAFGFNVRNMIKSYLSILRAADDMMIHFLQTASQAESIERFMKAAARIQEARYSWVRWMVYLIMAIGIAAAMVMMFK